MGFKQFRVQCTLRVLLIAATLLLMSFLAFRTALMPFVVVCGIAVVLELISFLRYVDKTNRDLRRFLDAIKHDDFSETFATTGLGSSFPQLKAAYNEVLAKFRRTRAEKEEHFRYLQTVVQHVGIGLLSFQKDGEVELINTTAKRLLKVPYLKNIRSLTPLSKDLVDTFFRLLPGEKALVKIRDNQELLHYFVQSTEFVMRERRFTLVSIQNIQSELDEQEMEAWQRLIRILTHEIMNSITPISSLAATAYGMLSRYPAVAADAGLPPDESLQDLRDAMHTIEKRSRGLLHFVDSYRQLTRIPKPNFQILSVESLFARVHKLMGTHYAEKQIAVTTSVEPRTLELTADPELVEQVLINLLMNAIQALEQHPAPTIQQRAYLDPQGRTIIDVIDNGPGILDEVQDKIFIPFFTTRKTGTGIGLSLSQQIMRLHKGSIGVSSRPESPTVFSLRF